MIPFIWNFQALQGCMGGGGHDTIHLEFPGFAGLHGVIARGNSCLKKLKFCRASWSHCEGQRFLFQTRALLGTIFN